jgi:microcystin-dependent protein
MTLYKWSQTAASNATADPSINWQEGQAPSSVNDSGRAMMVSIAKHRDDIAGAIVTGGTATAYTVTSYEAFDTLSRLNGQIIAFTPHATNGATVTLNVDSLGPRPLRSAPSTELLAGTLIQGTPYLALYNHSDAAFYLHGFFASTPYNVPLGGGMLYFGPTAPNSSFAFPYGQQLSIMTYASLYAILGTTYGSGGGTFALPDLRGRIPAGKDDMGGSAASRLTSSYFGANAAALGAVGGSENNVLSLAQLPTGITSSGSNNIAVGDSGRNIPTANNSILSVPVPSSGSLQAPYESGSATWRGVTALTGANSISVTSNNTNGGAHNNVQPTIICNYIIRVL